MGGVDLRRMLWWINRWLLVRGMPGWMVLVGGAILTVQAVVLLGSWHRLPAASARPAVSATTAQVSPSPVKAMSAVLPSFAKRFGLTERTLVSLEGEGVRPEAIRFSYDDTQEARLRRQTAAVTVNASWQEVGPMLERIQAIDRAAYISRLHLSREDVAQQALKAEVQVSIAYGEAAQ